MQIILVPAALGAAQVARPSRAGTDASLLNPVPLIVICWPAQSSTPHVRVEGVTEVTLSAASAIEKFTDETGAN